VDIVLTPSALLLDTHRKLAPASQAFRVVLGCDHESFNWQASTKSLDYPEVVLLGRLDPVKGHRNALRLFSDTLKMWQEAWGPQPKLHLVGEAANLSHTDIVELIAQEGLELDKNVLFTPKRVVPIMPCMRQASVGLVSSLDSEIICRVAEEFLLCGTPVVVSGVGSLTEVLQDSTFGASYLGLGRDEAASQLLKWILIGYKDSQSERALRSRRAGDYFSWDAMGKMLVDILEKSRIFLH
jgi:glycosyltransferase involved in cell wall biosynthesis